MIRVLAAEYLAVAFLSAIGASLGDSSPDETKRGEIK
jgi:hypothetical protein